MRSTLGGWVRNTREGPSWRPVNRVDDERLRPSWAGLHRDGRTPASILQAPMPGVVAVLDQLAPRTGRPSNSRLRVSRHLHSECATGQDTERGDEGIVAPAPAADKKPTRAIPPLCPWPSPQRTDPIGCPGSHGADFNGQAPPRARPSSSVVRNAPGETATAHMAGFAPGGEGLGCGDGERRAFGHGDPVNACVMSRTTARSTPSSRLW